MVDGQPPLGIPLHVQAQHQDRQSVMLTVLDASDILIALENTLRGYRFNREKQLWEPRVIQRFVVPAEKMFVDRDGRQFGPGSQVAIPAPPLLNEIGIGRIMTYLEPHFTHMSIVTDMSDKEVIITAREVRQWMVDQIRLNHVTWELRKGDWPTIINLIDHANFKVLNKSRGKNFIDLLTKTHSESEVHTTSEDKTRTGFFGMRRGGGLNNG